SKLHLGWHYIHTGEHDLAIEQLKETLELNSNFIVAILFLGQVYEQEGRLEEAIEMFEKGGPFQEKPGPPSCAGACLCRLRPDNRGERDTRRNDRSFGAAIRAVVRGRCHLRRSRPARSSTGLVVACLRAAR
ncbi:MAG: tetratricopeptide repeat protein, partial [Planctomycetes bacterium]|nr:tetratricopeptide repeat protein [Planctomycetota bacterium]